MTWVIDSLFAILSCIAKSFIRE